MTLAFDRGVVASSIFYLTKKDGLFYCSVRSGYSSLDATWTDPAIAVALAYPCLS